MNRTLAIAAVACVPCCLPLLIPLLGAVGLSGFTTAAVFGWPQALAVLLLGVGFVVLLERLRRRGRRRCMASPCSCGGACPI